MNWASRREQGQISRRLGVADVLRRDHFPHAGKEALVFEQFRGVVGVVLDVVLGNGRHGDVVPGQLQSRGAKKGVLAPRAAQ